MIEFPRFAKIKDNYCVCYFGPSDEYLIQLSLARPVLERNYPGVNVYLGCRDDVAHLLGKDRVLLISEMKVRKREFCHISELKYDGKNHPVLQLLESSQTSISPIRRQPREHTNQCVIISNGSYPTRNLKEKEVEVLKKTANSRGLEPVVNGAVNDAALVIGVESVGLFRAVKMGIPTALVPTGCGTPLYKMMAPEGQILNIGA